MERDMRKIVEQGYDKNDYIEKFRVSTVPNEMELYFLEKLVRQVGANAKVLDLGCGTGLPLDKFLADNNIEVTGIDISQKHIDLSKRNVSGAKFIKGDFSKFDFGDEKFDGIISFYAIFHIPREEHKGLFIKMNRLLEKDGIILITLGASESEYGEERDWCGAPMAWSSHEPQIYKQMLSEAGFNILEEKFEGQFGDVEFHYWVLAQKK